MFNLVAIGSVDQLIGDFRFSVRSVRDFDVFFLLNIE